ncbi:hypothetical protein [Streptomyces sp. YIM S03343]
MTPAVVPVIPRREKVLAPAPVLLAVHGAADPHHPVRATRTG